MTDWQCPCPECNGWVRAVDPEDEDAMFEPEHPENVSPERAGYAGEWRAPITPGGLIVAFEGEVSA